MEIRASDAKAATIAASSNLLEVPNAVRFE
jgi:hypothetical protein